MFEPYLTSQDRYRGCVLGLAVGDALGTTVEFCRLGSFIPVNDIIGGGHLISILVDGLMIHLT